MTGDTDRRRPRGERTRGQRIATYSVFLVFSLVCGVLWWSGIVEPSGAARSGHVGFPLCAIVFGVRLARELRGGRS